MKEDKSDNSINAKFIGRKVLIRTSNAGVHLGTLEAKILQEVVLSKSRRVYSWEGATTLSQLAMEGSSNISNCKIDVVNNEILLNGVIEVIPMTEQAIVCLFGAEIWRA